MPVCKRELKVPSASAAVGVLALCALASATCSSGKNATAAAISCGSFSSGVEYVSSCESTVGSHFCIDYYATPNTVTTAEETASAFCGGLGTVLKSPCPTTNTLGSCVDIVSTGASGASQMAIVERDYEYAGQSLTAAEVETSCTGGNGLYVPPDGSLPDAGAEAGVPACIPGGTPDGSGGANGFAFAIEVDANGQPETCTDFFGTVTSDQLSSVIANDGAMTSPCPVQNAVCACPGVADASVFGTTTTYIYYTSALNPLTGCPVDAGAACTTTYTSP